MQRESEMEAGCAVQKMPYKMPEWKLSIRRPTAWVPGSHTSTWVAVCVCVTIVNSLVKKGRQSGRGVQCSDLYLSVYKHLTLHHTPPAIYTQHGPLASVYSCELSWSVDVGWTGGRRFESQLVDGELYLTPVLSGHSPGGSFRCSPLEHAMVNKPTVV